MSNRQTKDFHWIGETLMAKEFGETVELCNVDWSGLDDFELEHKALIAAAPDLYEALEVVLDDLEIGAHPHLHIEAIRTALAKARGEK